MSDSMHIICPDCQSINRVPANKLAEKPNCGRCKMMAPQFEQAATLLISCAILEESA